MSGFEVLVAEGNPPDLPAVPALETIWPRVLAALRHYAWLNNDESRVQAFQHGLVADGAFLVPSLFGDGGDLCRSSFAFRNIVFYWFPDGPEEYFWVTAQLDRCYGLGALYFPRRRVALALYPYTLSPELLGSFEQVRAAGGRPPLPPPPAPLPGDPAAVCGHFHMIHHLWNELPALDRAVTAGLAPRLRVLALCQPLGPIDRMFPELEGRVEAVTEAELATRHATTGMFTALGAWTIPATTRKRVLDVAARHADAATLAEQERFRARHWPVFWLSVKPPQRTCAEQADVLAFLMRAVRARHPDAGFLLNGVSYPWDFDANPNYPGWFREVMGQASGNTAAIMDEVVARLPPGLRGAVRVVSGVPVTAETTWAGLADFYVCHGGSMQNKLGWLHAVPGVVHSNTSFMASARGMIPPVEPAARLEHFIPDAMVVDDDPGHYTPLQLARKDQNYRFASRDGLAGFVLDTFAARHPGPPISP